MARFRPFRGIRFSPDAVASLDDVVAPPYDVISEQARDNLYEASPYNVARLILNRDGHRAAAEVFRGWQRDRVLVRDDRPTFYLYCQEFDCNGPRRRTGIIGAMHLEPFSTGVVRPHERTFAHHKNDRLELTTEVKANLSPIFGLYSNSGFVPEPELGWDSPATIEVVHEEVRSRVWRLQSRAAIAAVTSAVANETVFIADVILDNRESLLRPGMNGEAKVIGKNHPWGWNLFHKAWDSIALTMGW